MKKYSHETMVGVFVIIGVLCMGYMAVKLGKISLFSNDSYPIHAKFSSISGLRVGNRVEMQGYPIGRVEGFELDQESQQTVVKMNIKNGIKIYDDAIATIDTAGLIGNRFISIDAGGSSEILKPGGTILETEPPVNIGNLIRKYAFGSIDKE